MELKVISLEDSYHEKVIDICSKSFFDYPQIPILISKPEQTKNILISLYDMYKKSGDIKIFGIKKDKKIICVSLCVNSDTKPNLVSKINLAFKMFKTIGIRPIKELYKIDKEKPKYEKTCLELLMYATLPSHQKKGYGRLMLDFLNDYSKKNNYAGINAVTNTSQPAFKFYIKEGWKVDNEFFIDKYKLAWIRKSYLK